VSADVINHGQSSILTNSSLVTTGTSPYTYQWFQKAPGGNFSTVPEATSYIYSFNTSMATTTGSWSFILQVNDNAGVSVNSSAVLVTVNPAISVSFGSGGSINPSGDVNVNISDNKTFTIAANTGYYIVDVIVNGRSVGAVGSYTFTDIQDSGTISATFAAFVTPSPQPTSPPTPAPTSTHEPTATPTPTLSPTLTPTPTASPKPNQLNLSQIAIFGVAGAIGIGAIFGAVVVLRKMKKGKS
jgi:hypothetical protein